jgi:hypothetical protein
LNTYAFRRCQKTSAIGFWISSNSNSGVYKTASAPNSIAFAASDGASVSCVDDWELYFVQ